MEDIETLLLWQIYGPFTMADIDPFYCGSYRDPFTVTDIEILLLWQI